MVMRWPSPGVIAETRLRVGVGAGVRVRETSEAICAAGCLHAQAIPHYCGGSEGHHLVVSGGWEDLRRLRRALQGQG